MTTTRPPFTLSDVPPTALLAAVGCFLGFGTSLVILLVADGLWMFFVILIPLLILQLIGHGILHLLVWAIACLWAMARGRPLPTRPPSMPRPSKASDGPHPWLRDHALPIAWAASTSFIVINAWVQGVFSEGFL